MLASLEWYQYLQVVLEIEKLKAQKETFAGTLSLWVSQAYPLVFKVFSSMARDSLT